MFETLKKKTEFENWAFGYTPVTYHYPAMLIWNSRWGHLYEVHKEDLVEPSLRRMREVYKDYLETIKTPQEFPNV